MMRPMPRVPPFDRPATYEELMDGAATVGPR
jgi:hypothetical protein